MSGFYNNWLKVQNPNLPNDIPQMKSGGFQEPFFFGGSQVPTALKLEGTDMDIEGKGLKRYFKTNFQPEVKGNGIAPTQFQKHSNIIMPRHIGSLSRQL